MSGDVLYTTRLYIRAKLSEEIHLEVVGSASGQLF